MIVQLTPFMMILLRCEENIDITRLSLYEMILNLNYSTRDSNKQCIEISDIVITSQLYIAAEEQINKPYFITPFYSLFLYQQRFTSK